MRRWSCLFLWCLAVGAMLGQDVGGRAERPNIVLIIADDQGWTDFGFMGHEVVETPRMDALARESLIFPRGYVPTALCSPSLATLLTGLYPHQHGITGNDPVGQHEALAGEALPGREAFIENFARLPQPPRLLGEVGYLSLQTGKYWMGHYKEVGFTEGLTSSGRHGSKESLAIGREGNQPVYDFVERAVEQGKPFFVWYAPFLPHTPHTPPERLRLKCLAKGVEEKEARYYAMIEWLDENVGELLDYLRVSGLERDTVVAFVVDNGWPNDKKGSPYELGVRTPIMLRWPGCIEAKVDGRLAQSIDLFPTLLDLAGVEIPRGLPGIHLLDERALSARGTLFFEEYAHDMADFRRPALSLRARSVIRDG